jgi:WD40 repeat protein
MAASLGHALRWKEVVTFGVVLALAGVFVVCDRSSVPEPPVHSALAPPHVTPVSGMPRCATTGRSWVLEGFRHPVWALAFPPGGKLLATGGGLIDESGDLHLWDLQAWNERTTLVGHAGCVNSLDFSPDGTLLVTGGYDRTLRLWDVATGQQRALVPGVSTGSGAMAFAPNGKSVGFRDFHSGFLMAWGLGAEQPHRQFPELPRVSCLDFDRAGRTLALGTADGAGVLLVDAATGAIQARLQGPSRADGLPQGSPSYLTFSRAGDALAVGYEDGRVELWDVAARRLRFGLPATRDARPRIALRPEGDLLAVGDCEGTITLTDARTGRERERRPGHEGVLTAMVFSPDGRLLATAGLDNTVIVWEMAAPKPAEDGPRQTHLGERP